mmetsp:Transcript_46926/g.112446  ORF Transcript_46926/g.112446 Transcript_46926/m.112446 type:complete len:254 (+) Transcript_46926:370-1131(+)
MDAVEGQRLEVGEHTHDILFVHLHLVLELLGLGVGAVAFVVLLRHMAGRVAVAERTGRRVRRVAVLPVGWHLVEEAAVEPQPELALGQVATHAERLGQLFQWPAAALAEMVQDGGVQRRARDVAHDAAVVEVHVERDAAERGLPRQLARRLGVQKLLLVAVELLLHLGGQLEDLGRQQRPAGARDDGDVDHLDVRVAEVLVDARGDAAGLADVAQHDLAVLQRRLTKAFLEQLEVPHLAVCVVRRAAWLVHGR